MWRVDVLGVGFTKSLGAICYSFALSGSEEFDSLTRFINEGRKDAVKGALEKIFNPNMRQWYSDKLIRDEQNINQRYMNRYLLKGSAIHSLSQSFGVSCQKIFGGTVITRSNVEVFGKKYPLPVDRLFGQPNGSYKSCICHGDMNSNNVILSKNGHVIFIDFQHTGRGHVFEDFITMEASVRMNYGSTVDNKSELEWQKRIELESNIDLGHDYDSLPAEYQLISDIRSMARANFTSERLANYYYGVAAFNCQLLKIPDLSDQVRGRLLCAILGGLKILTEQSGQT